MEVVGARPARQAKQRHAGCLNHLVGLAGTEVCVPPDGVHAEQLGVNRTHHLAHVDAHRREQGADFQWFNDTRQTDSP